MISLERGLMSLPRLLPIDDPSMGPTAMVVREFFRVLCGGESKDLMKDDEIRKAYLGL